MKKSQVLTGLALGGGILALIFNPLTAPNVKADTAAKAKENISAVYQNSEGADLAIITDPDTGELILGLSAVKEDKGLCLLQSEKGKPVPETDNQWAFTMTYSYDETSTCDITLTDEDGKITIQQVGGECAMGYCGANASIGTITFDKTADYCGPATEKFTATITEDDVCTPARALE